MPEGLVETDEDDGLPDETVCDSDEIKSGSDNEDDSSD